MQDTELPEKIEPTSLNFQTELAAQLAELAPEIMSDGKLDVTKLREMVNGDAENSPEKFGLFWPGKRAAQALAQIPTTATLIPAPEESVDWDNTKNIFIEGDNLEVLKALQNSYRRKVKMIYIDPPYNTGKEFIYPDKFSEGLQGYLEYTGQKNEAGENIESRLETGGRRHSNWLSMMYPRLQLAKSLLKDEGVIFISIDDNESGNLRSLLDEVFGEENMLAENVVVVNPGGRKYGSFSKSLDRLFVYAKNIDFVSTNEVTGSDANFSYNDDQGGFNYHELLNRNIRVFNSRTRPNLRYPFYVNLEAPDSNGFYPVSLDSSLGWTEIWGRTKGEYEGVWTWGKEKSQNELSELFATKNSKDGSIQIQRKLRTLSGLPNTLWPSSPDIVRAKNAAIYSSFSASQEVQKLFDGQSYFDFPKPVALIKRILEIGSDQNSIVIDFFSGSGTTAHAVMELNAEDSGNRTHIQVQLPEIIDTRSEAYKAGYRTISDIAKDRIKRAGKKIHEDHGDKIAQRSTPFDTGFRVYKLAPSNFVQWDENRAKDDIQQAVLDFAANKKPDAAPESLLAEIMLQARMPLSANIEKRDLQSGGWVYIVDGGNLIAYVANEQITEAQANEIADLTPAKLIVLDSAFNGNNALKINVANICKEKFIKEFKTI